MQSNDLEIREINAKVNQVVSRVDALKAQFGNNSNDSFVANLVKKGGLKVIEGLTQALITRTAQLVSGDSDHFEKEKSIIELQCSKIEMLIDRVS